jgi:O-antigen/teichoic acid export membrane protein
LVEIFHRLVLRAVMPVCLPYFARAVREEGSPHRGLVRAIALLTGIGWPFLACMGLAAWAAIRLMYGTQWMAAVPLAQVLCLVAAVELLYYPSKEALLSLGLARQSNRLQISTQALRALGLLAVVPWGLQGACWGLLAGTVAGALHSHWELSRHCRLTLSDLLRNGLPSLTAAACAAAPLAAWVTWRPINEGNYLQASAAALLLCPLCWLLALRATGHPLWQELARLFSAVRGRLQRRPAG